jgi:hypothetical protein
MRCCKPYSQERLGQVFWTVPVFAIRANGSNVPRKRELQSWSAIVSKEKLRGKSESDLSHCWILFPSVTSSTHDMAQPFENDVLGCAAFGDEAVDEAFSICKLSM